MNRVVFANRPLLSCEELKEAAICLKKKIFTDLNDEIVIDLAIDSFNYFE